MTREDAELAAATAIVKRSEERRASHPGARLDEFALDGQARHELVRALGRPLSDADVGSVWAVRLTVRRYLEGIKA